MEIQYLAQSMEPEWDAYVREHRAGTPFHLTAWRDAIELTFGHEAHYLAATENRRIVGVLPLFHVNSFLFGSMMVSVPFSVYGGVLADGGGIADALEARAGDLACKLGVDHLEFRDREERSGAVGETKPLYVTFRTELPGSVDDLLPWIPRKTRRMVRLGINAGLEGRTARGASDEAAFYGLFATNLRKLGTPAFPRSLISNLLRCFGNTADILLIDYQGTPVAGVLNFYFRNEVLPYYSGALEELNSIGLNNFLYYDLMVKSIQKGYKIFDFGRSKEGTGPYNFKRHFGFEPRALPYRYQLVRATELPNLNPTNPKYQKAIEWWKRMPLPLTTALGPWIVRGIP